MKIAVFCMTDESPSCTALQKLLEKKHIGYEVYTDARLSAEIHKNADSLFCDCTHCILLKNAVSPMTETAAFCFASGRRILLKTITESNVSSCTFDSFLDNEKETFDRNQSIASARADIINKGIPVLPDALGDAVLSENNELVDLFFKAGFTPDTKNSKGIPLLCLVVRNHCWPMAYRLIDAGADVNQISDDRGYSALMDAVAMRQPELVKNLLLHKADPNVYSTDGQTALILAVANHDAGIARLLLKNGADPDRKDKLGMSARAYAELFKKPELVQLFKNL